MAVEVATYHHGVDGAMLENVHEFGTAEQAIRFMVDFNIQHAAVIGMQHRRSALIIEERKEAQYMPKPQLNVELKKFYPDAQVPEYKSPGAAAFDLHAYVGDNSIILSPGQTKAIPTGIGIYLKNPDYGLFIWERSGLGKQGVERRGGLVDSDYQGEIMVMLTNGTTEMFTVRHGDRIGQAVIQSVWHAKFVVVDEFSDESERGAKGFGSSGIK